MNPFFLKVSQWAVFLYMRLGIAQFWYKLYQLLWERASKKRPLRRFDDLGTLVRYMRDMKWRADTWRQLFDAVSSPQAVQYLADTEPGHFIGDCDEFGVYQAAVINNELIDNPRWSGLSLMHCKLLTVMWYKVGGEEWEGNRKGFGGHNVCLLRYVDGTFAYMDYGWPSTRRDTIQEVVEDVRKRYAQAYLPLGWATSDPLSLRVVEAQRT